MMSTELEEGVGGEKGGNIDVKTMLKAQMMAKSPAIAAILALVFGGLGLFYVSILLGLVCMVVEIVLFVLTVVTGGLGIVLFIPWHIFCVIVALVLANRHNKKLLSKF